jgi:hypothetical protein
MKHRIAHRHSALKPTYREYGSQTTYGSTPMHHEMDAYLLEKGVDFDIATIRVTHIGVGNTRPKKMGAKVFVIDVTDRMMEEVVYPGLSEIAKRHDCQMMELRMTPDDEMRYGSSYRAWEII